MIRTATRLLPLLLAAATLQACATADGPKKVAAADPLTPTEQFPIEVRQNPDEVRLALHDHGLSPGQEAALSALVDRWRDTGGGDVTIQAPRGAGPGYAQAALHVLAGLGVPVERVRLVDYQPADAKPAPLIVGFTSFQAVGPTCGQHWDNLTSTGSNKPYANFGCAQTANIAAMVANPRDLVTPRDMTAPDATRRSVVLDKYRKGDTTSTTKDEQANASSKSGGGG